MNPCSRDQEVISSSTHPPLFDEAISEAARQLNLEVTWYRHDGNPVAIVRYREEQIRPGLQLERLELRQGQLYIQGTGDGAAPAGRPFAPLAAAIP